MTAQLWAQTAELFDTRLQEELTELARVLEPELDSLDPCFETWLKPGGADARQARALLAITPGSALKLIGKGRPLAAFLEQVAYNGRRLAKLHFESAQAVRAVRRYDELLAGALARHAPGESRRFDAVRAQLYSAILIVLHDAFYQVREAETQVFYDMFWGELESHSPEDLLGSILETLVGFCRAEAGVLYFLDAATRTWKPRAALLKGRPRKLDLPGIPAGSERARNLSELRYLQDEPASELLLDSGWRGRFRSCWSLPLSAYGRVAGVVQFAFSGEYEWLPRELDLLGAAAERLILAAEKAQLMQDLRQREATIRELAGHLSEVEEVERRRISRELHDEAGQSLLCLRLELELLEKTAPDGPAVRDRLRDARQLCERTIHEIRRLIAALSPNVLEQYGLPAAVKQAVTRFRQSFPGIIELEIGSLPELPERIATLFYRLSQECLTNAAKHSRASHIKLSLDFADGLLRLDVTDDGSGFDVAQACRKPDSYGLKGMRERITLLGGGFRIESTPGEGTHVLAELPVRVEPPAGPPKRRGARPTLMMAGENLTGVRKTNVENPYPAS